MLLKFAKLNPCENMTILVLDPVLRKQQAEVSAALMDYAGVGAEQVGFLETPGLPGAQARLQMMGGEFCGNAAMSMATLLAMQEELPAGQSKIYPLEVSGAEEIINCRVEHLPQHYSCSVQMPLPLEIREMDFPGGIRCPVVFFPGIAHAILQEGVLSAAEAERRIAGWCDICGTEAFGMLLQRESTRFDLAMQPLVYVKNTRSSVWERGCASGTAALGAWNAFRRKHSCRIDAEQPGGHIAASADYDGNRVCAMEISGSVRPVCIGNAWVDMPQA